MPALISSKGNFKYELRTELVLEPFPVNEDLECSSCSCIPLDPVQCKKCERLFDKECYLWWKEICERSNRMVTCPGGCDMDQPF